MPSALSHRLSYACNCENWPDADQRIARANHDATGLLERFENARRRACALDSLKRDGLNPRLCPSLDQVLLKVEAPLARMNHCRHGFVAHRNNGAPNAQRFTD